MKKILAISDGFLCRALLAIALLVSFQSNSVRAQPKKFITPEISIYEEERFLEEKFRTQAPTGAPVRETTDAEMERALIEGSSDKDAAPLEGEALRELENKVMAAQVASGALGIGEPPRPDDQRFRNIREYTHAKGKEGAKRATSWATYMTADVMKFYTAVAAVEIAKCAIENDPTICDAVIDQALDPWSWAGFTAFVVSQGAVSRATNYAFMARVQTMARAKAGDKFFTRRFKHLGRTLIGESGAGLALGAGIMGSDIFHEVKAIYDQKYEEYKYGGKDFTNWEVRWEAMSEMYHECLSNPVWLRSKAMDVIGLWATSKVMGITVNPLVHKAYEATEHLVRKRGVRQELEVFARRGFVENGKVVGKVTEEVILEARNASQGARHVRTALKGARMVGFRVLWKLGPGALAAMFCNPPVMITLVGLALIETAVFLVLAEVIGPPIKNFWELNFEQLPKLSDAYLYLEERIRTTLRHVGRDEDPVAVREAVQNVKQTLNHYRSYIMQDAQMKLYHMNKEIEDLDVAYQKANAYYRWFMGGEGRPGFNFEGEAFQKNPGHWHEPPNWGHLERSPWLEEFYYAAGTGSQSSQMQLEVMKYLEAFFCTGRDPVAAVESGGYMAGSRETGDYRINTQHFKYRFDPKVHLPRIAKIPHSCFKDPELKQTSRADAIEHYRRAAVAWEKAWAFHMEPPSLRQPKLAPRVADYGGLGVVSEFFFDNVTHELVNQNESSLYGAEPLAVLKYGRYFLWAEYLRDNNFKIKMAVSDKTTGFMAFSEKMAAFMNVVEAEKKKIKDAYWRIVNEKLLEAVVSPKRTLNWFDGRNVPRGVRSTFIEEANFFDGLALQYSDKPKFKEIFANAADQARASLKSIEYLVVFLTSGAHLFAASQPDLLPKKTSQELALEEFDDKWITSDRAAWAEYNDMLAAFYLLPPTMKPDQVLHDVEKPKDQGPRAMPRALK